VHVYRVSQEGTLLRSLSDALTQCELALLRLVRAIGSGLDTHLAGKTVAGYRCALTR